MIIPECGSIYCPWEIFQEFSLSRVDINCIQEPLKSSVKSSISSFSHTTNSTYEILMIVFLICFCIIIGLGVLLYSWGYRITQISKLNKFIELKDEERFNL